MRRAGRLLIGAALAAVATPLAAQNFQIPPGFGNGGVYSEDPASKLARYLRMVTASPQNLEALTGAGRAALDVGDAQAAIGFYARAEAIAPRNGRIKAGLGSALVLLNQEQAALRYFDDATDLGVPEADIASDRGLAHDLRGSAKRAQRDYAVALRRGENPETTRRMALSLAISGERDAALALLVPLLARQDTAAWRARAFILAMTGDTAGASKAAESVMPASTAAGFVPFFRKLPTLKPGEKAAAVHFGHFPGEGRPMRIDDLFNQAEVAARVALENAPRGPTDAGTVDGSQAAFGRLAGRAPDGEGQLAAKVSPRPSVGVRALAVVTPRTGATAYPTPRPGNQQRIAQAQAQAPGPRPVADAARIATSVALPNAAPRPVPTPAPTPALAPAPAPVRAPAPAPSPAPQASTSPLTNPAQSILPGFGSESTPALPTPQPAPSGALQRLADVSATVREVGREPAVRPADLPPSSVESSVSVVSTPVPSATAPATRLADIARVLAQTPTPAPSNNAPPAPQPKVEISPSPGTAATAIPAPSRPKVETSAAPPAPRPKVEPSAAAANDASAESRVWVQIASGTDASLFAGEWRRLQRKAPDLLSAQTAWTTPLKTQNRLLVGPFVDDKQADALVRDLKPAGISAFTWTSPRGQAIARLAGR